MAREGFAGSAGGRRSGGSRAAREEEQVWAKVLPHIHSGRWCAVETSGKCGFSYVDIAAGGLGWGQRELGREGTFLCPPRLPPSPLPCYGTAPSVCLRVPGVSWKELRSSPCCSGCSGVFAVPSLCHRFTPWDAVRHRSPLPAVSTAAAQLPHRADLVTPILKKKHLITASVEMHKMPLVFMSPEQRRSARGCGVGRSPESGDPVGT